MKKKEIDVLTYKVDSFDTDCFQEDIMSFSSRSIIFLFNNNKIWMAYKPEDIVLKKEKMVFFKLRQLKINYYIYPLIFFIDHFNIAVFFLRILIGYRVKTIVVENTYAAVIFGLFRKMGLCKKMVYLPGDWLQGCNAKGGIWNKLGSNVVFPLFDYLACKFSDVTLNCTEFIQQSRRKFWGRVITNKESVFQSRFKIKAEPVEHDEDSKKILFMGTIRRDSGIELLIESLKDIRKEFDVSLKIFGTINPQYEYLRELAKEYNVDTYIEFMGFIERENFKKVMSDCFCGVNLLTSTNSYTTKTLPSKLFDYLQYLLPVIVTENMGPMCDVISEHKLGVVVKPREDNLVKAESNIFRNQVKYRKNIVRYLNSLPPITIGEYLD